MWEERNIDRWSRSVDDFSSVRTESGAKYPPALSAWVHELETDLLLQRTRPTRADAVIDLGAGGGRFSTFFAPRCGRVTAVEPSDLIGVLRANAARFPTMECLHRRIQDIAFDGEFTIALISGVLMYMPHEAARLCLRLAARALKAGGMLVLREPVARGGLVNVDWQYYRQGTEPRIPDNAYFEHYRDPSFYRHECASHGLRHRETTISHAPVFHFLPQSVPFRETLQGIVPFLVQNKRCRPLMKGYNALMRHPYAMIMDALGKKTMRFHFFIKEGGPA